MSIQMPTRALALAALVLGQMVAQSAVAGGVADQFRGGAFGLPWNASKSAIQAKYPGGKWGKDDAGRDLYCAASRQTILKLPPQFQSRELCMLMGPDNTLGAVTARVDPSLASLLAVVNRSRTTLGDFDSVRRDQNAIQSKYTYMLWTRDRPYLVQVASANDNDGNPVEVTFTVADEPAIFTSGATAVSNKPPGR